MIFALACDSLMISNPLLVLLGEASYCLYVLHATVLRAILSITKYGFDREPTSAWLALFCTAMAILAAVLAYKLIELPSRRYVLARFRDREDTQAAIASSVR